MTNFIAQSTLFFDQIKAAIHSGLEYAAGFLQVFSNFWMSAAVLIVVFSVFLGTAILCRRTVFKKNANIRTLTVCALLVAINVILGTFNIPISNYLRIGFGFITVPVAAAFFGPGMACLTGMTQDVVSYLLNPVGGYLFTYTLSVGVGALIYGWMLYDKEITFWRILVTKLLVIVVVNIVLSSIALAPTVGAGLIGILPARIIKNLLLFPIQAVVVYILLKMIGRYVKRS